MPRPRVFLVALIVNVAVLTLAVRAAETSASTMRVTLDLPRGANPVPPGPFAPTWESIRANYRVPAWLQDGKFGIFIHWGLYSVPARNSEWYPRHMYATPAVIEWHRANFGPQDEFGYKDFIPQFKAEHFDPGAWADLFRRAGARYVMPVAEHHDGFAMYDSALTTWDAKDMGPQRDLIGELAEATRAAGLVFCLSMRPWHRFGEGPTIEPPNERDPERGITNGMLRVYTAQDMRFTTQRHAEGSYTLYVMLFAWPSDGNVTITSLADGVPEVTGEVDSVTLLGNPQRVTFVRDAAGLKVKLPPWKPSDHANVLKITGLKTP